MTLEIILTACHSDPNEIKLCCPTEVTRGWSRLALMPNRKQSAAGRSRVPVRFSRVQEADDEEITICVYPNGLAME